MLASGQGETVLTTSDQTSPEETRGEPRTYVMLNNGRTIPQLGFGVFQVKPADTVDAVTPALEAGDRHIDTAEMYGNENGGRRGHRQVRPGPRGRVRHQQAGQRRASPRRRARGVRPVAGRLGFDYLDLFLIHWPLPTRYDGDFVSTWRTLEEFYRDGRARSIGVSNFQPHHIRRLHAEAESPRPSTRSRSTPT